MLITRSADALIDQELYQYHVDMVKKFLLTNPSQEEILKLKKKLLTIHTKYYSSKIFSHLEIAYYLAKKQALEGKKIFINDFKDVIEIFYSDINDYSKFEQMKMVYQTKKLFNDSYEKFLIPFMDDPIIQEINKVFFWYSKCVSLGIDKEVNYINGLKQDNEDFKYAKVILMEYLRSKTPVDLKSFFLSEGYDEEFLKYSLELANTFDVDLYKTVLDVEQEKKLIFIQESYDKYSENMNNIFTGIRTGYNRDNTRFDMVDFWCNIPFKGNRNSYSTMIEFIATYYPDKVAKMMQFLTKNKVTPDQFEGEFDPNSLYSNNYLVFIGKRQITDEDNDIMLEFMRLNNIPMLRRAYNDIRKKYVSDTEYFIRKNEEMKGTVLVKANSKD